MKQIEVREYILPKFFVKAYPSEILLVEKKKVSVTIESSYTFGKPVSGTVRVDLYFEEEMEKPDMSITQHISGITKVEFALGNPLEIHNEDGVNVYRRDVFVKVEVMETFTSNYFYGNILRIQLQ